MTEAELDACFAEMASDADYQGDAMALAQRSLRSATGRLLGAENSLVVEGEIARESGASLLHSECFTTC